MCTQPRRISAITVSERVAAERGEQCGDAGGSVGYQVRRRIRRPSRAAGGPPALERSDRFSRSLPAGGRLVRREVN